MLPTKHHDPPLTGDNKGGPKCRLREDELGFVPKRRTYRICGRTFGRPRIKRFFPCLRWARTYSFLDFQYDLIAGFTVGMTVIPQSLAYATIAGLPLEYGLYSSFLGCFVYTLLGTSKDITYGPTAVMSLLVFQYSRLGQPLYAILLTFVSGIIQLLMGFLRLGFLISFISYPVLHGFTNAAAVIIGIGQIKNVLGIKVGKEGFLPETYNTFKNIGQTNVWDCVMGITCLLILLGMKKLNRSPWIKCDEQTPLGMKVLKKLAWVLLTGRNALVITITAVIAYILTIRDVTHRITLTPVIPAGLPPFRLPKFYDAGQGGNSSTVVTTGQIFREMGFGFVTISLIGILEALAIAKSFARKHKYTIDATQEFIALGTANFLSSFVGSYPVTASFSRTAINSQTGVRTPLGGVYTGIMVLLALSFVTSYFRYIPKASLAAMIISAILNLIEIKVFCAIWKTRKSDFLVAMATLISCFFVGIEFGIILGIVLSLAFLVFPVSRPHLYITGHTDTTDSKYYVIKPNQSLLYPSSEHFAEQVTSTCLLEPLLQRFEAETEPIKVVSDGGFQGSTAPSALEEGYIFPSKTEPGTGDNSPVKNLIPNDSQTAERFVYLRAINKRESGVKGGLANAILDCSHISSMDYTSLQELQELSREFRAMDKEIVMCNVNEILAPHIQNKLKGIKEFPTLKEAQTYLSVVSNGTANGLLH